MPQWVPLEAALNFLHDGTTLTASLVERDYDRKTLDDLQDRLCRTGARLRGEVDGSRPDLIEPAAFINDYYLAYIGPFATFDGGSAIVLVSRRTYPAAEVKDRICPVRDPNMPEPRYRLVLQNLKVEVAGLLRANSPTVTDNLQVDPKAAPSLNTKAWLTNEVTRRKSANNVPDGRGAVTEFSEQVEKRMAQMWRTRSVSRR